MDLDAGGTVPRTRRLGALYTAQGFLPGKFLAIAEIHFSELGGADFWRLLRHVLPRQLHAVLNGHRIQRWLGGNGHWVTPFAAQTPCPSASVFLRCDSSARRYSARDCCSLLRYAPLRCTSTAKFTWCASTSGPSTQANWLLPSTSTRQPPHMPVPSIIMGLRLTSVRMRSLRVMSATARIMGMGPIASTRLIGTPF